MDDLKLYVTKKTEEIISVIDDFIIKSDEKMKWFFCLKSPVCIAEELFKEIIGSQSNAKNRIAHEFIIASLTTRYLFDLSANLSVMLKTNPESLRNERQERWLRLQDLDIVGASYAMPINNTPDNTKKRLLKNESKTTKFRESGQNRQQYSERSTYSIPVSDKYFLFEDPWGLKISEKIDVMPLRNPNRFLEQWKLYSHISHASAFSLMPTWVEPIPVNDAIQVYSIILKVVSDFLGIDFDMNKFIDDSFDLLREPRDESRS